MMMRVCGDGGGVTTVLLYVIGIGCVGGGGNHGIFPGMIAAITTVQGGRCCEWRLRCL